MTTDHFSKVAPVARKYAAVLFDMDGTLIDSTPAVIAHWTQFGKDYDIDPTLILTTSHGRRTIDIVKQWKPELANMNYVREVESQIPKNHAAGAKELPGAQALVSSLDRAGAKWAIVTSGTSSLAEQWIKLMGLPRPKVFVTADKVINGKPDPEGYLLAREQLGLSKAAADFPAAVLVVEDAPAGIRAGKAAGCDVLALLTTHSREEVEAAGADFVVEDLESVEWLGKDDNGILLLIDPNLPPPTASLVPMGVESINGTLPN